MRVFGTDGIRGQFGGPDLNPALIRRAGRAAMEWLRRERGLRAPLVVVGRDTRDSGSKIERLLCGALISEGAKVRLLGVVPTPCLSYALKCGSGDLGIMITASHNPASDNGLKFFCGGGMKLDRRAEAALEEIMDEVDDAATEFRGYENSAADAINEYCQSIIGQFPARFLEGLRIVVDMANGATTATAPRIMADLGAEVVVLGNEPDGHNINCGVGSEHPLRMVETVRKTGAALGFAFDGDGDRVVVCDDLGEPLWGEQLLFVLARMLSDLGKLAGNLLVTTVVSNLALDRYLEAVGLRVMRVPVGDRNVAQALREGGYSLGGEPSGHIIFSGISWSADGVLAALKTVQAVLRSGQVLSRLRTQFRLLPSRTENLTVSEKVPFEQLPELGSALAEIEHMLAGRGRILVRYSGTEPKIRLLAEAEEQALVDDAMDRMQDLAGRWLSIVS